MTGVYSLDTAVLFAIAKEETQAEICNAFIKSSELGIVLSHTVEKEYFTVLNNYFQPIRQIIKEIGKDVKNKSYEEVKSKTYEVFKRYKSKNYKKHKNIEKRIRDFIRVFESGLNLKIDSLYKNDDEPNILMELHQYLMAFERKFNTSFELVEDRVEEKITFEVNNKIHSVINKIINNKKDSDHLTVTLEYVIKNNKWGFFVTLDEKDLLSKSEKIGNRFFFIWIQNPMYASIHAKKFIKKGSPLECISAMNPPTSEIKRLNGLTKNSLGISLL